jgi:predicted nucleic acid-binding protein
VSLYAESSAILAWLLDEPNGVSVREFLAAEELILSSDLTLIECDRVLDRAVFLEELTEAEAADRRAHLAAVASHWVMLRMGPEVIDRARQPFPIEPVRTLDAIHLASVLVARSAIPDVALLSLDTRVRSAATRLGIELRPASCPTA